MNATRVMLLVYTFHQTRVILYNNHWKIMIFNIFHQSTHLVISMRKLTLAINDSLPDLLYGKCIAQFQLLLYSAEQYWWIV